MIGIVYYSDDPHQRVFRTVHLYPWESPRVFKRRVHVTQGIPLDRQPFCVMEVVTSDDPRLKQSGTPWTLPDDPLPVPLFPEWSPTSDDTMAAVFDLLKLTPSDVFVDVGSGDGRIVLAASKLGAKAFGIEIDPTLYARATFLARGIVGFKNENALEADYTGVTAAYLNLGDPWVDAVVEKLPKTARIVAINCKPDFAVPETIRNVGEDRVLYWLSR